MKKPNKEIKQEDNEEVEAAIRLLKSKKYIVINPSVEFTITAYALKKKLSKQVVQNWCRRKQIKFRVIPQLNNLKLVQAGTEEVKESKKI